MKNSTLKRIKIRKGGDTSIKKLLLQERICCERIINTVCRFKNDVRDRKV